MKIPIETNNDKKKENHAEAAGGENDASEHANAGLNNQAPEDGVAEEDNNRPPLPILTDDVDELKKLIREKDIALEISENQRNDFLNQLQRMKAEFENFRKRTIKEKSDMVYYANERLLAKLLPVLDNLQRGGAFAAQSAHDVKIVEGINMVERQLLSLLEEYEVAPYEAAGLPFDPNIHHPLYAIEKDDVASGTVIDVIEPGYKIKDKILREAKVSVSKAKEDAANEEAD